MKKAKSAFILKKKKITLEIAIILTVLDTAGYLPSMHHFLSPLSEVPDFIPACLPPLQSPESQARVDMALGSRGISRLV